MIETIHELREQLADKESFRLTFPQTAISLKIANALADFERGNEAAEPEAPKTEDATEQENDRSGRMVSDSTTDEVTRTNQAYAKLPRSKKVK